MALQGKKIAFLVAPEGVEQVELTEPWAAVQSGGGRPVLVVGGDKIEVQAFNHLDRGDTFEADLPVSRAGVEDGPWTLIETGALRDRTLTSWPSLQTDLRNAGAVWVDEEVVVDTNGPGPLISSRNPEDLPAFTRAIAETF